MKPIDKNELYQHVGEFLKGKGIELTEGSYSKGIHATCSLLADAINLSQAGLERAKTSLDKKLDQVRQAIHEKTAPKQGSTAPPSPKAPQAEVVVNSSNAAPTGKKKRVHPINSKPRRAKKNMRRRKT